MKYQGIALRHALLLVPLLVGIVDTSATAFDGPKTSPPRHRLDYLNAGNLRRQEFPDECPHATPVQAECEGLGRAALHEGREFPGRGSQLGL